MEEDNTASESVDCSMSMLDNTRPSQLQEITMDQDLTFSNTFGARSPAGRTVKEVEEQLSNFKKENFDLKLRIYFLEEKMGVNYALDKDNVLRKNTELQVQVTNLQRELKEKYDLLCQAVKALEMEEDEHRKLTALKEEQLVEVQEELEDLRLQLQDMRLLNAESTKSGCSSSRQSENTQFVHDYTTNSNRRYTIDGIDTETQQAQQQLASFIYDTSETLRQQIEALQKDCDSKDQAIDSLTRELLSANERLIDFAQQVKDYEEKLSEQHQKNTQLLSAMQEEQKSKDKLKTQLASVNQKFTMTKFDFDQERAELLREKKALSRTNAVLDMRLSVLDEETRQQKQQLKELQAKLEASAFDAKKKENIAVSISRAATAAGAAQADLPDAQVGQPVQRSPSKSQIPSTPDAKHLVTFEKLLLSEKRGDGETLRAEFAALKSDFHDQSKKIIKLKSEQLKACEIIKSMMKYRNQANDTLAQLKKAEEREKEMEDEIVRLKKTKEELEKEMENVVGRPQRETVRARVSELNITAVGTPPAAPSCERSNMADDEKVQQQDGDAEVLVEQYKQFTIELEAKIEVLEQTLKEKDSQLQHISSQNDEIFELLEEKENRIVDLEFELLSMNETSAKNRSLMEKGDHFESEKRGSFYIKQLDEKDREIAKLNGELRKCTCYLQEIVNKELWEKNREIEKMHVKQGNSPELLKLRKELCCKDLQLKLLTKKIDELGLDIKLTNDEDDLLLMTSPKLLEDQLKSKDETISRLEVEKEQISTELKKTEHLLQQCNGVCASLSNRLEELAIFLDSLLKQKSILGFLGSAKNKRLREIVNNTLDISRSFSISLVNPEQSLTQLHNITILLNDSNWQDFSIDEQESQLSEQDTRLSIVRDNISLTYQSHLYKKPDSEHVIEALREQVFSLKNELKVRDNELNRLQNERESGVEPMSESEQEHVTPKNASTTLKALKSEAQSESEAWSEPDRTVSRARIGLIKSMPKSMVETSEDDDMFDSLTPSKRRSALMELNHDVYRLQHELDLKSEEIISNNAIYRQNLQEADNKLQESKENLLQAKLEKNSALQKVEILEKSVQELEESRKLLEDEMVEKNKDKQNAINELEKEKLGYVEQMSEAKHKLAIAEEQVKFLQDHFENIEKQLRKQYEADLIVKLKDAEESFVKQIKSAEEKCDAEIKIAQESVRLIQEEYARDYVKKVDVEIKLSEAENLMKKFAELKATVADQQKLIESHKIKEQHLERLVQENQNSAATLQCELGNCQAHCCQIEQEKQILEQQKVELGVQLNDNQNNLALAIEKHNEQVATLQKQKLNLELKISELEFSNADLHNRLTKAQTSRFSLGLNATLPTLPLFRRHEEGDRRIEEAERAEANSSPDLGIESDHGRFSSLETNGQNISSPLLHAVRLTESMNDLFDAQMDSGIKNVCDLKQCCQKSIEVVAQENNELKRKLLRMKRALEETATQLNLANQRKKQVEKTICKQIHKTSQVLRKAKANLDSGSESDVFRM